jgi:hypothetical protein
LIGLSFIFFILVFTTDCCLSPPSPLAAAKAGSNHHGLVENPLPLRWDWDIRYVLAIQPNHIS